MLLNIHITNMPRKSTPDELQGLKHSKVKSMIIRYWRQIDSIDVNDWSTPDHYICNPFPFCLYWTPLGIHCILSWKRTIVRQITSIANNRRQCHHQIYAVMANLSASFLSIEDDDSCILCAKSFNKNDVVYSFTQKGWPTLVKNASKWKSINVPVSDPYYFFTAVHEAIENLEVEFGKAHEKCRIILLTKSHTYRKRYGDMMMKKDPNHRHLLLRII